MCEPTTIMMGIGLASSVISSGLGMAAQADQADAQEAAIRDNQRRQQEAMKLRQQQQHEADSQAASELARRARVEESAVRASSGESGVSGNSVLALLNTGKIQLGMDTARVGTNADARNAQNKLDLQGINAGAQSQINNIQQPDFIGGSLSIIKAGATAYDQYKTSSDPTYKSFRG